MDIKENIDKAAKAFADAEAILITAGAGIGVDSGLPDFRGNKGFWKAYPPIAKLGISFSEMANPQWFEVKPHLAWAFYGHRLNLYRRTTPHQGFFQLLKMADQKPAGYFVFTSNVDGQFQKAGYREDRIEECHGSIHHLQCTTVCSDTIWDGSEIKIVVDEKSFEAQTPLPRCIKCGGLSRPNILMFGDWSWISSRTDAQSQRFSKWLQELSKKKIRLLIIEIGAGEAVPTVRMKSEYLAQINNGTLIRINPRDYYTPSGHISIPLGSADGINQIYERVKSF
ncbi:NAD-dependent deacetylase [candidate division KSB1 bacterium]